MMPSRPRRNAALIAVLIVATALGGCARVRGHQGYLLDPTLVAAIAPGVDNRDSVEKTLGRPTFVAQFDPNEWIYVSRDTRQFAFSQPKPVQQTVLRVRFDAGGNVANVQRSGVEQVASINPIGDKTPTLGRNRGFFEDIFGNIGRVGAPVGPTGGGAGRGTRP